MTGEVLAMAVNPTPAVVVAKPEKTKAAKLPKAKKAASHPPFFEMVRDAIVTLKERTGSSQYAITKFIEEKHKQLPPNFRKLLLVQLKKLVASGKLTKVKASYKLSLLTKSSGDVKPAAKKREISATKVTKTNAAISKVAKVSTKTKAVAKPKTKAKVAGASKAKLAPRAKSALEKAKGNAKAGERPAKVAKTSSKSTPGKRMTAKTKIVNKARVVKKAAAAKSTTVKKLKTVKKKTPSGRMKK